MSPEIPTPKLELDPSVYSLTDEERAFMKSQTGIESDDELKKHIIALQEKAWKVYPYPCIWRFGFAKLKISRLPAYPHVLNLGKERQNAIFLDMACCFGTDTRKIVVDGFPASQVIASDYRPDFWHLGHELYKSTSETFPVAFVAGDAFDSSFITAAPVTYEKSATPTPSLASLTALTPLQGHISAIHAFSFFHLFKEAEQYDLAKRMATLLSPEPGSVIFGSHIGAKEKGELKGSQDAGLFCHSPESWTALWNGSVFKEGSVKVDATLVPIRAGDEWQTYFLVWSVTRL
ncbi:hypothetical protein NEOLEDRAFT_1138979 [Neolentinus lepideus HHB14362 ss-1]|uniref:Methyltransferase domain-containing protein n=1 Tax=Neolentinus lepideus HHB14362 ss-1 TaxID=1314782 RepID=A0A165Q0X9_9AGAM|nr:hypothetical protein NEOLEDRAFT_1138979 [Neolentinus lepideus HHB14362 ss-1]